MYHVTGSAVARRSVLVEFVDADEQGSISAHTCSKVINLPRGAFTIESYEKFKGALQTITAGPSLSFNMA